MIPATSRVVVRLMLRDTRLASLKVSWIESLPPELASFVAGSNGDEPRHHHHHHLLSTVSRLTKTESFATNSPFP